MIKVPVHNIAGEFVEEIEVDESELGGHVNKDVLRQAIVTYEANRRAGTAKAKSRAELSYSNKKPWRQKHTGRARAGSRASPLWRGGGVIFGPVPRDHSKKLNKKMRRKAVASAILAKLHAGQVKVLDNLELTLSKTSEMVRILRSLGARRTFLLVLAEHDPLLWRCTRNIAGSAVMTASELNAYQVIRARDVIFTRESFYQVIAASSQTTVPAAVGEENPCAGSE